MTNQFPELRKLLVVPPVRLRTASDSQVLSIQHYSTVGRGVGSLNKPECDIYNLSRSFVKGGTLWELLRRLWLEVSLISICRPCSPVILSLFNRFRPSQSSKYLKYKMLYCGLWPLNISRRRILYFAKSPAVLNSLGLNSRKWYIFHVRTGQGFNVIFMHQRAELHLGKLVGV